MHIEIKRLSGRGKDESMILLLDADQQLPAAQFSKEEISYFKKERKAEKKFVLINRLNMLIYLQVLDNGTKALPQQLESARKAGASMTTRLIAANSETVVIKGDVSKELIIAFAEGMALSGYQFSKYKSNGKKEATRLKRILIDSENVSRRDAELLQIIVEATFQARDLVNEPPSFLTSVELGKQFIRMAKESGFRAQVLDKSKIRQLKMGGLLAVNQGSVEPPTFTIIEWKPARASNKKPVVLVGKGVVYDTGGMSLKPTGNSMDFMKSDMAGGATVAAAVYAVAKAKLPVHVIALIPSTDNRPDGNAYVPGDVITMMSGKTVEVLNTDAEGRLILADALEYAKRYKPELVLEFSTLTGAAAAAIGPYGIVCMGKVDDDTRSALMQSGEQVYERLAEFPFWTEYDDLLKSDIADLKNIGGAVGGAITAGRFLSNFTDFPFMHFDIAGPAFSKSNDSYRGKNGTGVGVRLLFDFILKKAGTK